MAERRIQCQKVQASNHDLSLGTAENEDLQLMVRTSKEQCNQWKE